MRERLVFEGNVSVAKALGVSALYHPTRSGASLGEMGRVLAQGVASEHMCLAVQMCDSRVAVVHADAVIPLAADYDGLS